MKNIIISVFIPVYNGEVYLKRTIESLKSQTFKDFEVIFYDDCSNDNSVNIILDNIKDDKRFLLKKSSNNIGLVPKIVKKNFRQS